ncbi:MAG: YggS family pyridoxal phosphate-dependent enzyme, partial [Sedimentisphaerales bacterium]
MVKISEKIKRVEENIKSACERRGRDRREVKLIVVTKSASFEDVMEVIRLGITELGENRVQQLKKVSSQLTDSLKDNDPGMLK